MRKLGALVLAVPALVAVYLATMLRRGRGLRIAAGLAGSLIVALVVVASLRPTASTAIPPSGTPAPVAAELLNAVRTGQALRAPFVLSFSDEMDGASVAAALRISPDVAVTLLWDATGRNLTIMPVDHWQPDTLYAITVDPSARSTSGGTLTAAMRALMLTAPAGRGEISASGRVGTMTGLDTTFQIQLDRPMATDVVRAALRTEPAIAGDVTAGVAPGAFTFQPAAPLQPGVQYHVWLEGLVDTNGVAFGSAPSVVITTATVPAVVRLRPLTGTGAVDPATTISVRFTERMDRARTAAAFRVTVAGKALPGKVSWAEQDTVLVFHPASNLAFGAKISVTVGTGTASAAGVTMDQEVIGTFTVKAKPPAPAKAPAKAPAPKPIPTSGGGGAVSGSWTSVEAYYLQLMNCTRTGGWVTSTGACSSPGGRNVAPLALDAGISSKVTRPYAKYLAVNNLCNHFYDGNPGTRLARAGYTSYRWGENIGCGPGSPNSAVLYDHLFFQNEQSTNGGHYVNLMNAAYDRCGIGVWVASGRVRLVIDFYHP